MSEYIVRETGYPGAIKQGIVQELVRCKDCRHFFRDDMGNVVVYRCELNHMRSGHERQTKWNGLLKPKPLETL